MGELLKSKVLQAVLIAVASALLGGLAMGWISLPTSVKLLEAKATAFESVAVKHDTRITGVEKDYVGKREMEGHMTTLHGRIDKMEGKFDSLKDVIIDRLPDKK